MTAPDNQAEPWTRPWPADGLESVPHCPVCGEPDRAVLYENLVDNVFRVAPGKWTLWKCAQCGSVYLDPRPTRDTIPLAYSSYYTHQEPAEKDDYKSLSPLRKLRRRLVNGYTNWRFSTRGAPASRFGVLVLTILWSYRKALAREYRHLPRCPKSSGSLLDVGCGNGAFLKIAESCGWDVVGLDPDPKAAANAKQRGLAVHEGGIEYFEGAVGLFDVITLNHVIEHVHDPIEVLKTCHTLLKPGGQLWLETPNIASFGHAQYGKNWRGLESPRHLILFNRRSLKHALTSAGYSTPRDRARPSACAGMFKASDALERDQSADRNLRPLKGTHWHAAIAAFAEALVPRRREFLTVTTRKAET